MATGIAQKSCPALFPFGPLGKMIFQKLYIYIYIYKQETQKSLKGILNIKYLNVEIKTKSILILIILESLFQVLGPRKR